MKIEYSPPRRRQPVFACVGAVIRLFTPRIRIIALGGELDENCIYLANHSNKSGPIIYSVNFPVYNVKWGAHQMLGNYSSRKAYMRDVLYIQKNGLSRKKAAFKAFFEAFFSPFIYRGMKVLPTYTDGRLMQTVKKSVEILGDNTAITIFPENSNEGYFDEITEFFSGFVVLAKQYKAVYGKDVPMRPVYFHKRKRLIVVDEPCTLADFKDARRKDIAEAMKNKLNALYHRIESGEFD